MLKLLQNAKLNSCASVHIFLTMSHAYARGRGFKPDSLQGPVVQSPINANPGLTL